MRIGPSQIIHSCSPIQCHGNLKKTDKKPMIEKNDAKETKMNTESWAMRIPKTP